MEINVTQKIHSVYASLYKIPLELICIVVLIGGFLLAGAFKGLILLAYFLVGAAAATKLTVAAISNSFLEEEQNASSPDSP